MSTHLLKLMLAVFMPSFLSCIDSERAPSDRGKKHTTLGLAFENGEGRPENLALAAMHYEKGCAAGSAHGCGSLGVLRFYGHGGPIDISGGLSALNQGCDGAYGQACTNLGIIYALNRGVIRNTDAAVEFFRKGCSLGSELGCSSLCHLCIEHSLARCEECSSDSRPP